MDQHEIGSQSSTARRRLGWRFVSNKAGTKKAPGFKATHFSSVDRLEAPTPLFGARYQAEVLDESGFHHVKKKHTWRDTRHSPRAAPAQQPRGDVPCPCHNDYRAHVCARAKRSDIPWTGPHICPGKENKRLSQQPGVVLRICGITRLGIDAGVKQA